jgi:hypothetical protein
MVGHGAFSMTRRLSVFVACLALALAAWACADAGVPGDAGVMIGPRALDASEDAAKVRLGSYTSGGGGGGGSSSSSGGAGLPAAPLTAGTWLLETFTDAGATWTPGTPPAFTVSLVAVGGTQTKEIGAVCTPTYNATPQANAGTIAANSPWVDNQGHSTTTTSPNPLTAPSGGSYTLTAPGSVTATITETQLSPPLTASGSATGCSYFARWFAGVGSDSSPGTGTYPLTASGTSGVLGGTASGTLAGTLSSVGVGTTIGTFTPAFQYVFIAVPHTASRLCFQSGGFAFPTTLVATDEAFTNVQGLSNASTALDVYESTALLNATYTPVVIAGSSC